MIVVITSGYPFGGEPFLSSESPFLPENTVFFALSAENTDLKYNESRDAYVIGDGRASLYSFLAAAGGLFDKNIHNEIISLKRDNKISIKSIRRLFSTYSSAKKHYRRIIKILENNYADKLSENLVIYSYWMEVHAVVAAMLKNKYFRTRAITRCHGYDLYEYRHETHYIPFRQLIFSSMDLIAPISENGRQYLLDTYGNTFEEKIIVNRLGTKDMGINPVEKGDRLFVVSCSSITKVKRIELIIKALSLIVIPITWVHFGEGDLGSQMRLMADEMLASKDNVKYYFTGYKPKEEILNYYLNNHIDLFINTSESEGIPVSIMEAMSFGIPVVATDVGGTGEIVDHGKNGRLVNRDVTPEIIADNIMYFANLSETLISEYREDARNTWEQKYRDEVNYKVFSEYLVKG